MKLAHPIQPLEVDESSVLRFKQNAIVVYLLRESGKNLHELAQLHFSVEDHQQLAQLLGYSLDGFADLPYASQEIYETAMKDFKSHL